MSDTYSASMFSLLGLELNWDHGSTACICLTRHHWLHHRLPTTSAMFKVPVGPRTRTSWTTIVTIHRNRHQPIVKVESVRVRGCRARHRARGHGGDDPGPAQHHSPQSEMFFFLVGARFNGQVPSYGDMMGPTLTHVVTWDNSSGTAMNITLERSKPNSRKLS